MSTKKRTPDRPRHPRFSEVTSDDGDSTMNKCELSNGFEQFWNTYLRKVAKGAARRAYEKAGKLADHAAIMAGLGRYIAYLERYPTESRFICHASTWLNQERWTDELRTE